MHARCQASPPSRVPCAPDRPTTVPAAATDPVTRARRGMRGMRTAARPRSVSCLASATLCFS